MTVVAVCTEDSGYGINGFYIGFESYEGYVEVESFYPPVTNTNIASDSACAGKAQWTDRGGAYVQ